MSQVFFNWPQAASFSWSEKKSVFVCLFGRLGFMCWRLHWAYLSSSVRETLDSRKLINSCRNFWNISMIFSYLVRVFYLNGYFYIQIQVQFVVYRQCELSVIWFPPFPSLFRSCREWRGGMWHWPGEAERGGAVRLCEAPAPEREPEGDVWRPAQGAHPCS